MSINRINLDDIDLENNYIKIDNALNIYYGSSKLKFTSLSVYNEIIRRLESKDGSITKILENTIVYLAIAAVLHSKLSRKNGLYIINEQECVQRISLDMSPYLKEFSMQFLILYMALMGIDDYNALIRCYTLTNTTSWSDKELNNMLIVGDTAVDINNSLLGFDFTDTVTAGFEVIKYIQLLKTKYPLPQLLDSSDLDNYTCTKELLTKFFNLDLFNEVVKHNNIKHILYIDSRNLYSEKEMLLDCSVIMPRSIDVVIAKQRMLGRDFDKLPAIRFSTEDIHGILSGASDKLDVTGDIVLRIPSNNQIIQASETKIFTYHSMV